MQAMLVPAMLLDVTERSNIVAGHAEHGLGTLDRPEQTLLLMQKHCLLSGDGIAALRLEWTENEKILLKFGLQQLLSNGETMVDIL